MTITKQNQIDLIEQIVKADEKYADNEDLLLDFCNEAYSKSYLLFSSVSNPVHLKSYIGKVASNAIITVLKRTGRFKKSVINTNRYMSSAQTPPSPQKVVKKKPVTAYDIYEINDPFMAITEFTIDTVDMQKMFSLVRDVNNANRDKQYSAIFSLRYLKGKKQQEIAQELGLPKNEVNQRLIDLSEIIKANFAY